MQQNSKLNKHGDTALVLKRGKKYKIQINFKTLKKSES